MIKRQRSSGDHRGRPTDRRTSFTPCQPSRSRHPLPLSSSFFDKAPLTLSPSLTFAAVIVGRMRASVAGCRSCTARWDTVGWRHDDGRHGVSIDAVQRCASPADLHDVGDVRPSTVRQHGSGGLGGGGGLKACKGVTPTTERRVRHATIHTHTPGVHGDRLGN